jgi:DNA-binding HxlR family transcriptional regulator
VLYSLTPLGETLSDPLVAICQWAMDHLHEMQAARAMKLTADLVE